MIALSRYTTSTVSTSFSTAMCVPTRFPIGIFSFSETYMTTFMTSV
ncbi:hypothetical protein [Thermoplasma acidophilum]|nr:hypothetical protein [Thermoplasma acidophilum]